ncbi:MAG: hypothetical protein AB8E87_11405 [Prochlorococcus sp.]
MGLFGRAMEQASLRDGKVLHSFWNARNPKGGGSEQRVPDNHQSSEPWRQPSWLG